jgi:hypothetical protein
VILGIKNVRLHGIGKTWDLVPHTVVVSLQSVLPVGKASAHIFIKGDIYKSIIRVTESIQAHPQDVIARNRLTTREMTVASCTAGGGTLPVTLTVGENMD